MNWPWQESKFELEMKLALGQINQGLVYLIGVSENTHAKVKKMAQELDALNAQVSTLIAAVAAEGDAVKAATLAIAGLTDQQALLTQQLQDAIAANDPVAIQAAADAIAAQNEAIVAQTTALAAAIPAVPEVPVG